MDSPTPSSEPLSSAPQRSSLWKRVAGGVGIFLVCYLAVAYGWKSVGRRGCAGPGQETLAG